MITEIFKSVLITSLAGSAAVCAITLIRPLTKKLFGYSWHYYIWLAVLLTLLLPVRFNIPKHSPISESEIIQTMPNEEIPSREMPQAAETPLSEPPAKQKSDILQKTSAAGSYAYGKINIFAYLWFSGMLAMLFASAAGYIRLKAKIRKNSSAAFCPEISEYTSRKIAVFKCRGLSSPFMTGILSPKLILPEAELTPEQLHNILRHEMTHFKRHDIIYKWLAQLVKCIHWFNPAVWYAAKQIGIECEISCDIAVVTKMNKSEEMNYINTILTLLPAEKTPRLPLTTHMAASRKMLKRRFIMIKNRKKTSRIMSLVSVLAAAVLASSGVLASGLMSERFRDNFSITVTDNGRIMQLANKPFVYNSTVYLPLREMLADEGITDITYDSGTVRFSVPSKNGAEYRGEIYPNWINRVTVGSSAVYIAGHSEGSTENSVMIAEAVIRNDLTYVPYDFFVKLGESEQGIFNSLTASAAVQNGEASGLYGYCYRNDNLNFTLALPLDWSGKYIIIPNGENRVDFLQKAAYEKYGEGGMIFYIERIDGEKLLSEAEWPGSREIVMRNGGYTYLLGRPTDTQFPIDGNGELLAEDAGLTREYDSMSGQVDGMVAATVKQIVMSGTKSINYIENSQNPSYVTEQFFKAFENGDYETMKQYCTQSCIDTYFKADGVFGIKTALLTNIEADGSEYLKSSNDFKVFVGAEITPAEISVYSPEDTAASFYVNLLRTDDGYKINAFTNG